MVRPQPVAQAQNRRLTGRQTGKALRQAAVELCRTNFGGLDTLVNCAGIFSLRKFEEISEEEWDRMINVNLKGVFLCCQAVAPLLRLGWERRDGTLQALVTVRALPLNVVVGLVIQLMLFFVVAEVVPKTYAIQHTDRAALR